MNVEQTAPNELDINGNRVQFPQRVKEYITLDDKVIIRLYVDDFEYGDLLVGRNVMAYGPDGKMIWRVPEHNLKRDGVPEAFFGIYLEDDGTLWAGTPGLELMLDPETGEYLESKRAF
jgi:hypothetical protein